MKRLHFGVVLSLLIVQIVGLGNSFAQDEPLKVVATYSILGDVVQNVAGEAVELTVLVTADGDSHTFEPTPQDGVRLLEADLIFENGIEFETWLDDLYTASGSEAARVVVSDGVELRAFEESDHDDHDHGDEDHDHEGHDHGDEDHDHDHDHDHEIEINDLSPWAGEWNSAYRFVEESIIEPAYTEIQAALPSMTVEEVKAFIVDMWHTDFEDFTVEGNTITYQIGAESVTCEYVLDGVKEGASGEYTFDVAHFVAADGGADCEPFTHALFTLPHGEGAGMHYHIRYGSSDFDTIMNDPAQVNWFPSLYPASLTADELAAGLQASGYELAAFIATATGQELAAHDDHDHDHGDEDHDHEGHDHSDEDHDHEGHHHGEFDPHIWQNPLHVIVITENVRDALIEADPANAETYTANAAAYIAELQALDAELESAISLIPAENRKLVTSHDALGYFADRYGFEVIATVLPSSTEAADPSAGEVAEIIETITSEGVPAVFIDNVSNPDLMQQIAEAAGVEVAAGLYTDALGAAGSEGDTYLNMMRYNVAVITAALQ